MTSKKDKLNPYSAAKGSDNMLYVNGPGQGLSYYNGALFPKLRLETPNEAARTANIANIAYNAGYQQALADVRQSLGL